HLRAFIPQRILPMAASRSIWSWFRRDEQRRAAGRRFPSCRRSQDGRLSIEQLEDRRLMASFTEFPIPTPDSEPEGIALGPDGNIWFVETGAQKIGRITPQGQLTEFSAGITQIPLEIVAGPDGNLWFTEQLNSIGRITPAGVVTEFPVAGG